MIELSKNTRITNTWKLVNLGYAVFLLLTHWALETHNNHRKPLSLCPKPAAQLWAMVTY